MNVAPPAPRARTPRVAPKHVLLRAVQLYESYGRTSRNANRVVFVIFVAQGPTNGGRPSERFSSGAFAKRPSDQEDARLLRFRRETAHAPICSGTWARAVFSRTRARAAALLRRSPLPYSPRRICCRDSSSRGTTLACTSLACTSPKPARDDTFGFATTLCAPSRPISRTPRTNDAYEFPRKDGGFGFGRSRRNVSSRFKVSDVRAEADPRDEMLATETSPR